MVETWFTKHMRTNRTAKTTRTAAKTATACKHCGTTEARLYGDECFPCGWSGMAR